MARRIDRDSEAVTLSPSTVSARNVRRYSPVRTVVLMRLPSAEKMFPRSPIAVGTMIRMSQAAAACDFATVDTALGRRFYALFFIDVLTRRVTRARITTNPTGVWTTQAARNLFLTGGEAFNGCKMVVDDRAGQFTARFDDTGAQLFFRLVAGAYERRSLGIASHWPFENWGRFIPEHTAVSLLDRLLHHAIVVATEGESHRMKEARSTQRSTPKTKA